MIIVNSEMFLNLRGHVGHASFSATPFTRLLGKRGGRLIFDFASSVFTLKKALNFALHFKQSKISAKFSQKIFIVVQNKVLAFQFKNFFFLNTTHSKHIKIFYNWVSGSLTRSDSEVNLSSRIESSNNLVKKRVKNSVFTSAKPSVAKFKNKNVLPFLVIGLGEFSEIQPIVMEAFHLRIPTVAVVDSNFTGREVTFPIFGNDDSLAFLFFVGSLFIGLFETTAASNSQVSAKFFRKNILKVQHKLNLDNK